MRISVIVPVSEFVVCVFDKVDDEFDIEFHEFHVFLLFFARRLL